jgi:hypothetical protein
VNTLPTITELVSDPCTSYWLKDALRSAINRDLCDAVNDAEILTAVLKARLNEIERIYRQSNW